MSENFNLVSHSLGSQYVFYERLKDDTPEHQKLHASMLERMNSAVAEARHVASVSSDIRRQASAERAKETALIQTFFGASLPPIDGAQDVQTFIDLLNDCLNLKQVYERNKTLIMNSEGQKGVFSFFGTYLERVLNADWERAAGTFDFTSTATLSRDVETWLEQKVPEAIEAMFKADVENLSIDPQLRNAYMELLPLIGQVTQHGSYSQELARIYGLDDIKTEIMDALYSNKQDVIKSLTTTKANIHSRGGFALESLGELIMESIKPTGHGGIGSLGAKADHVATFGIDISQIADRLEEITGKNSRQRNIALFSSLEQNLQGLTQGFIVYTSDKNYTLNAGFRARGGYSAGEDITAGAFEEIMAMAGKNMSTFVGAILQFNKGAIGEGQDINAFEEVIAKNIAYLLFDDFTAIGAGLTNSTNTLHLMNLNGILVPISSILYALADSIDQTITVNPRQIVSVNISTPEIKFPTSASQSAWVSSNGGNNLAAWDYQREEALQNTKISTHFLASLQTLLRGAMLR